MSMEAWITGALRTPIATENGDLANYTAWELGKIVALSLIETLRLERSDINMVIFGNALYAGGNPARLSGLAANIPIAVPAMTIDTQCCSGMDAIIHAARLVQSGAYDVVLAGGAESHSTAPRRLRRSQDGHADVEYNQPPFSPWPDKDPDMIDAAAQLAAKLQITRAEQEAYAIRSHVKARQAKEVLKTEFVTNTPIKADCFTRPLSRKTCSRLPIIAGDGIHGITASTAAVKADGAALVAIMSKRFLDKNPRFYQNQNIVRIIASSSIGCDPSMPALAPVDAIKAVLSAATLSAEQINVFEIMEAFASQAIACIRACQIDDKRVNLGGGALARGHPIGASGAVNVVRLFHEMTAHKDRKYGLATIAGAGGLGSAIVLAQ